MARYGDGKMSYLAVLTLFETCQPNNITTRALSPQIFAHSGRHYLWVQNDVICFARGAHLNMLWVCFVFIQENMRAGVAVEPWDTCFLIWINCVCGNNTSSYLTTMLSKLHEILKRPWESINTLTYQNLCSFVMICQRYWTFTIFHAIITPATRICDPIDMI